MRFLRGAVVCALVLGASACRRDHGVHAFLDESYPDKLSEWRLFTTQGAKLVANDRVFGYDVRTPLFANYASKKRTVWMPPGKKAAAMNDGSIDFPVGTIFTKTFAYPAAAGERRIETRLLVRRASGWVALPYVWNTEQTEATLAPTGDMTSVTYRDDHGAENQITYSVPNVNQCRSCHDQGGDTVPIGPKVRNLDAATLHRIGLAEPPRPADSLDARARAYLDANCAHCHNPNGSAMAIPLDYRIEQTDPARLGVRFAATKPVPNAPGLANIIEPGNPDRSLLVVRMESTEPKIGMPTLGHDVVDREGIELIRQWIRAMKPRA